MSAVSLNRMSTHTNFLILGTGGIGSFIIDEFLRLKESGAISTVKIASRSVRLTIYRTNCVMTDWLTRSQEATKESHPDWFSRGGELAIIDHSDESTLLAAFKGVEVVITAIAFEALEKQKGLVKAAKAAGVKLYVPTEYSIPSDLTSTGILSTKTHLNTWFKEFGFPYVRVFCGMWPDYILTP